MKYVVGNWKMNLLPEQVIDFIEKLKDFSWDTSKVAGWIAPQSLYISSAIARCQKIQLPLKWGAQNTCHRDFGAFTGELSPNALNAAGGTFTILGHSERRQHFQENDQLLAEKIEFALKAKLQIVFCVGETLEERKANQTLTIIQRQLSEGLKKVGANDWSSVIIAYEPVWAIGTGLTATPVQVGEVHEYIYKFVKENFKVEPPILYGGSVNPKNFAELLQVKHVHGGLVGGASLRPEEYMELISIGNKSQ